jgi:hypothetical protein
VIIETIHDEIHYLISQGTDHSKLLGGVVDHWTGGQIITPTDYRTDPALKRLATGSSRESWNQ